MKSGKYLLTYEHALYYAFVINSVFEVAASSFLIGASLALTKCGAQEARLKPSGVKTSFVVRGQERRGQKGRNSRPEGVRFLRRGSQPLSAGWEGFGEHCKHPSGVRGRAEGFSCILCRRIASTGSAPRYVITTRK